LTLGRTGHTLREPPPDPKRSLDKQESIQGSEYAAAAFTTACRQLGIRQSMGRVGSALDNAAHESFHSTLEFELLSLRRFATRDHTRAELMTFIDHYNQVRRHSTNGMRPPTDFENTAHTFEEVA
jgi:putative transposase